MSGITVRRATPADVAMLAAFNVAMARETEDKALDEAVVIAGAHQLVSAPGKGFYLVAEAGGSIAGCLGVTFEWSDWRNGLFWWIQSVYVEPAYRRQGVFRSLYERVMELARRETDVCGVRLYVEKENTTAQQTYLRLGMSETGYRLFEMEFDRD